MAAPRIKDIAARAGVHTSTVSLALRNSELIAAKTREHIQTIAREMNYRPNYLAKGLAGERTHTIGVLVNQLTDDFNMRVFSSQEQQLRHKDFTALMFVTHMDETIELKALNDLVGRRVDGIIINYPVLNGKAIEEINGIAKTGLPMAIYLSGHQVADLASIDKVDANLFQCGYDVTRHLLELGHRRISVLTSNPIGGRVRGYREALAEYGVEFDPRLIIEVRYPYSSGVEYVKEIMSYKQHPTAVFAYNDDLAVELLRELHGRGYHVPNDISIASVNDDRHSSELRVPLTTMRLPQEEIGRSLVDMVLRRLGKDSGMEPQSRAFDGKLIIRDSTAPPRGE